MFERTPAGLTNSALFYDTDLVVYTEGKEQTKEDDLGSIDLLFWTKIFETLSPTLNVRVLCRGSKLSLLTIARQIVSGSVQNVAIALDRDYDFETKSVFDHPAIIYSYGYSWENDVWTIDTILKLIETYALVRPLPSELVESILDQHRQFMKHIARLAKVNLATIMLTGQPAITAKEYRSLVSLQKTRLPYFSRHSFLQKLHEVNTKKERQIYLEGVTISPQRHGFGHLLAYYGYHLTCSAWRHLGQAVTVNTSFINISALQIFSERVLHGNSAHKIYYQNQIDRLTQSLQPLPNSPGRN